MNQHLESSDTGSASTARRGVKRDLARIAGVALFFVAMAWLLNRSYVREEVFDIAHMRKHFQSHGLIGVLSFIGFAALINALGVPRLWVCAAAGTLFGALYGSAVGFAASLIGATANFLMGRYLMRGPLKRRLPKRFRKWHKLLERDGFRVLLYMRLFPFSNATLTSLIGGASRIRYRDYLAATLIGFAPQTIAFAMLGSSAAKQNRLQLVLGIALFALVTFGQWIYGRSKAVMEATDCTADRNRPFGAGEEIRERAS